ncbi:SIS domain-containing protein, partial [Klebsiella pneumoniae]|uniref:SIS domain-containing protein n=1 Tax=Klebsiella pneumoniae TaxID=573 RepID=UPI003013B599
KAHDDSVLRAQVAQQESEKIGRAVEAIHECIRRGGKLIIFGNGGSATDANDWALDCILSRRPIPAISLSLEPANLSAIANDVGTELIFQRQLI